jgi:hypothetical protein
MRSRHLTSGCWIGLLAAVLLSGCQTGQLRIGSINQAASYGDIQEQQVLDPTFRDRVFAISRQLSRRGVEC